MGSMGMVLLQGRIKLILGIIFFLALACSIVGNVVQGRINRNLRVKLGTIKTLHAAELKQLKKEHKAERDELRKQLRDRQSLRQRLIIAASQDRPDRSDYRAFLWELRRPRQRAPNLAERRRLARQGAKLFERYEKALADMLQAAKAEE